MNYSFMTLDELNKELEKKNEELNLYLNDEVKYNSINADIINIMKAIKVKKDNTVTMNNVSNSNNDLTKSIDDDVEILDMDNDVNLSEVSDEDRIKEIDSELKLLENIMTANGGNNPTIQGKIDLLQNEQKKLLKKINENKMTFFDAIGMPELNDLYDDVTFDEEEMNLKINKLKEERGNLQNVFFNNKDKELDQKLEERIKNNTDELIKYYKEKIEFLNNEYNKISMEEYNTFESQRIRNEISKMNKELKSLVDSKIKYTKPNTDVNKSVINEVKEEDNNKLENVRIVFDGSVGEWKILANLNGKEIVKLYEFRKDILFKENNAKYDIEMKQKYGLFTNEMDYNLYDALSRFDKEFNTNLSDKYATNKLRDEKIIYDFTEFSKVSKLQFNFKEKTMIKKYAELQKDKRNAELFNFKCRRLDELLNNKKKEEKKPKKHIFNGRNLVPFFKKVAIVSAGGVAAAGIVVGGIKVNKYLTEKFENLNKKPKSELMAEADTDEDNVDTNTTEKVTTTEVPVTEASTTESPVTTEEKVTTEITKEEPIVTTETPSQTKEELGEMKKELNEYKQNIISSSNAYQKFDDNRDTALTRLTDEIHLKDTVLHYDSNGSAPTVNTDTLDHDYYKISLLAVRKDNKVIKLFSIHEDGKICLVPYPAPKFTEMEITNQQDNIKNLTLEEIKERYEMLYGGKIDVQVNFDAYKNRKYSGKLQGWVDIHDIKVDFNYDDEKVKVR